MDGQYATYPSLTGKQVLITGGATGIGKAFVEAFVSQGAQVSFLDKDEAEGRALETTCGPNARFYPGDVTETDALAELTRQAAQDMGGLGVLIANAANDARHTLDDLTSNDWDACLAVNLKHQFFAVQAAHPIIASQGGGSIICMGSIAWLNNTSEMIAYTTAKAGVHGLVRTLARQLGPKNIRVNALLPGWTMTERQLALWVDDNARETIDSAQCLPGFVMSEDVARMALFLAADDSAMCAQQAFIVDGGWV